jgi:hypothetical protein
VSGQLESHHFFRTGDTVRALDGRMGSITEGRALYAVIEWDDTSVQEIDQFDPSILVVQRAEGDS